MDKGNEIVGGALKSAACWRQTLLGRGLDSSLQGSSHTAASASSTATGGEKGKQEEI